MGTGGRTAVSGRLHPNEVRAEDRDVCGQPGEFTQGHPTLGLQTDIDDGKFLFDADDLALDDGTFLQVSASKRFVEHLGEVFTRGCCSRCHGVSCLRRAGGLNGVPIARADGPADQRRLPESRLAGAKTVLSERWFDRARFTLRLERGFVLQQRGALLAPSARPAGLDDVDGGPDCRVYIQMRCIEQVRIRSAF